MWVKKNGIEKSGALIMNEERGVRQLPHLSIAAVSWVASIIIFMTYSANGCYFRAFHKSGRIKTLVTVRGTNGEFFRFIKALIYFGDHGFGFGLGGNQTSILVCTIRASTRCSIRSKFW